MTIHARTPGQRMRLQKLVAAWAVLAAVHATLVLAQAVLAGQFLSGEVLPRSAHRTIGDDVLPYVALATLVMAVLIWRPGRGPTWPALASLVLLVADIAQLTVGFAGQLQVHVPLGVAIFGFSTILVATALMLRSRVAAIAEDDVPLK